MVNIWTPERNIPASPYLMLLLTVFSLVILSGLLPFENLRVFAALALPFLALAGGFSTLMAMCQKPELEKKHPKMRTVTLLMMAGISLYMLAAVFWVAS